MSRKTSESSATLTSWPRPHYQSGGGDPFLFYVVFGNFQMTEPLSRSRYRSLGVPEGLSLQSYSRDRHADTFGDFCAGYLWERLEADDPELAGDVRSCPQLMVLRGTIADPPTLDYLRDAIGLLTYLVDHGGVCIYDPQMFEWWAPQRWREVVFEANWAEPLRHVVILHSEEETGSGRWVHTRGLRKFGRPDLSVPHVPGERFDAVVEMCARFIVLQASGFVIPEGEEIRMKDLPPGGRVRHRGHPDDPDFNNVHVRIVWE
jgi:hypothetical protein